jgi:hypothetical protein
MISPNQVTITAIKYRQLTVLKHYDIQRLQDIFMIFL